MTPRPVGRLTMTLFVCLSLWGLNPCVAQRKADLTLPKIGPADFTLPASKAIDSSTNAVILADLGDFRFVGNKRNWFSSVFTRHTRIKILNKKAFDAGTVRLWLQNPLDHPEKVDRIEASTYSLDNGQVTEVKLDKKDVLEERYNKEEGYVTFTLPALREGSIIDYTYTITSDYYARLRPWDFQSERYPCLLSDLNVVIPQTLNFVVVKQGIHPYTIDKGIRGAETYRMEARADDILSVTANTISHHWLMKDIPAFRQEAYLTCAENYIDKIDLQLTRITNNGDDYYDYYNSWKRTTDQLLAGSDFGVPLDDDNPRVAACVAEAVAGGGDLWTKARSVYYYVCQHFTCDDRQDMFIRTSLNDVIRKQAGTVGDINLLLIAMLRKIGLAADPVVLSTRDYGYNLSNFPELHKLNYCIARVKIEGKVTYLDAAHSRLGFGQLDGDCYNGHARIISKVDSGSIWFEADSLRETKTTIVSIAETKNGEEGTWASYLGQQESYRIREQVARKGVEQYFKDIQTRFGEDAKISDGAIDSLDRPEDPATVHYSFVLHPREVDASKIYVDPFIAGGEGENPFKAAERKYPIEMPYARDETYVFTLQIPDGYSVEELPKSTKASLNGSDGSFEYLIGEQGGMVQLRCKLKVNKANFAASDYGSLRDFFGLVVKKEAEVIVLKKN